MAIKSPSPRAARGQGLFTAIIYKAMFITSLIPTYQCHNTFSSTKNTVLIGEAYVYTHKNWLQLLCSSTPDSFFPPPRLIS